MNIPFSYGKIVDGDNFTDRSEDTKRLYDNFLALTNTTVISPRRWGKSSLVNRVLKMIEESTDDYIIIRLDAFNLKTEESFLEGYARSVSHAFTRHGELREFIAGAIPSSMESEIIIGNKDAFPLELRLKIHKEKKELHFSDIINLPQKLSEKKNKKVIVCIDEFHVIAEYDDSMAFQRKLRSCWQAHDRVAYCLFGSKFNMMTELVGKPRMPLYKFGDMLYLQKISTENWTEYITEQFVRTGKEITGNAAGRITELVENHSYYVQQLAQLSWFRTTKVCTEEIVNQAFAGLVNQLSMIFTQTMEELRPTQCEFLRAVCDGVSQWNSVETLGNYQMGTAANVKNHKKSMEKKEITTSFPKKIEIQDPVFKYWLISEYFKKF